MRPVKKRSFSEKALVVELVDTQDLKSCDHCGRAGSSPARGTESTPWCKNSAEVAQLVEHDLAKVGVASSSLVFRSKRQSKMAVFFVCDQFHKIYRNNEIPKISCNFAVE